MVLIWANSGIIKVERHKYYRKEFFMNQSLPKIIPVNELKNTANIMKTCLESDVPIVITRNGYGEAVMMSIALYEEMFGKIEEAIKINEALQEIEEGAELISADDFFKKMKAKYAK